MSRRDDLAEMRADRAGSLVNVRADMADATDPAEADFLGRKVAHLETEITALDTALGGTP